MNTAQLSALISNAAPIVIIFGLFYFMILRPQQARQKEVKAQIAAVKRGDRVLTAGGIVGTVAKVRDQVNELEVDIAPNVRVTVMRNTLTGVLAPVAANDKGADKAA